MSRQHKFTTRGVLFMLCALQLARLVLSARLALAAESDQYPWADATVLNQNSYDWGYEECQPAMLLASACNWHNIYKLGKLYHESDPWRYDVRNCTSYVAWRVNHEFGLNLTGWGDARNWDDAALNNGYHVGPKAQVGDIAVWEGYYGHVAFVVAVNTDGSVNVEQYNRAGKGEFSKESRLHAPHYIHVAPEKIAVSTTSTPMLEAPKTAIPIASEVTIPPAGERPVNVTPMPTPDATANPLGSTSDSDYVVAVPATGGGALVYMIQHSHTASGRLEVSESNIQDGNSSWLHTWATAQLATGINEADYKLADADGDGMLDLYQIKHSLNTSGHTEVSVLSGANHFANFIGTWITPEPTHASPEASYDVGDYDGDGALDLYKISQPGPDAKLSVKVLSGAKGFEAQIGSWESEETSGANSMYKLGDHDHDGRLDIYQISHNPGSGKFTQVKVLDAGNNYLRSMKSWSLGGD